jgi:hypothetical protein
MVETNASLTQAQRQAQRQAQAVLEIGQPDDCAWSSWPDLNHTWETI